MIRGVKFVSIAVRDQEKALAFYTEKLGFRILTDQPFNDKQRWLELGIPGADTRIVLFSFDDAESRIGKLQNVVFWSDDVKATYEQLNAKGVEFVAPPKSEGWGTSAIFKDVDGNQFVLSSK